MGEVRYISLNGLGEVVEDKKVNELELSDTEKTLNQRIANLRKVKRLTQKEFAEKLNVSDKLVSRWEQEGSNIALEDIVNISERFILTLDYLVHGKKSKSDVEALKPVPPPLPPFVDPIQNLVKKIDEIISKNKLQKYKEQLFPSSSEEMLYDIAERVRKATLEDWGRIEWEEEEELRTGGYICYIYRGDYVEDRRSAKKPIDEKYWAQVEEIFVWGRGEHISKSDKNLLERGFGIFRIKNFGRSGIKKIGKDEFRLVDYDISFEINFSALLALDDFEIYSKLTSLKIPTVMQVSVPAQFKKSSGYFDLPFDEVKYYEIFEKLELKHPLSSVINNYLRCFRDYYPNSRMQDNAKPRSLEELNRYKDEYFVRNLTKAPITYQELLGLTDLRFFGLLKKGELDILLDNVNLKHKRVWEVISAIIEYGATRKKLVKAKNNYDWVEEDDALATLVLYEFAKMKINK